ncbi:MULTISPECIES: chitosanase [unclassified Bradyrhizobium]|uniref:chitosanase n=1 Tax=unclassified Bradyrhizobium TaxID=2631580 RepID=UPI0028EBB629|nr:MULTISPECIES: chitosanase [unclassified Bradyrhizobium]
MAIRMPPGPAGGVAVVEMALNDLMADRVAAFAASSGAPQLTQPIRRFVVKLNELTDAGFLARAKPVGWRYLVIGGGSSAVADVKHDASGAPDFDSLISGDLAARLAKAAEQAEQIYGSRAGEFEARILDIPAIYMSAFWLHGPRDIFIPLVDGHPSKPLPPREDASFILRAVQAAASKRRAAQKGGNVPNPADQTDLQRAIDGLIKAALQINRAVRQLSEIGPAAASPAMAAPAAVTGGAAAATTIQLTADQRLVCERMINAFETGSVQGDYSNITVFNDGPHDIRQITYGRSQTTEYGNLRELVAMYSEAGGRFSNELRPYVERIGRVALVDDATFKGLLRQAGAQDPVMRETQDVFFDRRYFKPALAWANTNGFTRALSVLVIYDSFIHSGGILDLLRARFREAVPARGGNEQTWIREYTETRNDWLLNHHRPAVRASAYRTRDLMREIGRNNWDLAMLPISANGVQVDARPPGDLQIAAESPPPGVPFFDQPLVQDAPMVQDTGGEDPGAPVAGEFDDLASEKDIANFGEGGALDLAPLGGAAGPAPLLTLDMNAAWSFLQACMTSRPRVTYGLGKKVPFLGAVPGRDFTQVDCSGFVREALRRATSPALRFPDGSVNQHDWIRAQGFAKSTVAAATQSDGLVRIAFLRPQDTSSHIGHVVLISGGKTLESHGGGVGPDSRPWTGASWQASTFVYVLAHDHDTVAAIAGMAMAPVAARQATFSVKTGHRYRATLSLQGLEQFASNDMVAARLQGYGFINVTVTGSGGSRSAEGTWGGADTTAQLDAHIIDVVEIPAGAAGRFA